MSMTPDLTKLQTVLDGETDIIVRRDFSHPPAHVWRALTEPALIRKWMAQDDLKRCEMDLRPGGSFRYEWESFYFSGPILEVDTPHHMVHVEYFNGDTTSGATIITDLVARGTGTRMTQVMRYANAEARAAAIEIGMTDGLDEVYEKLEVLLTAE
ncbi:SRPBCC domain-containing protein [Rhizobium sp. LjRoot254]|uniref:SRPBCC domain-containing protein n=1 Tax=Rhizobium sp. LjRoot254 TaxID=3342297 RepID=UPI003ED054F0